MGLCSPLLPAPARVRASLQALLRMGPHGRSSEQAKAFKGHAPKRFLQNVCEASPHLSEEDGHEVARFSLSTAQRAELEPHEALLLRHQMRVRQLPNIYAKCARVPKAFDRLARVFRVVREAIARPDLHEAAAQGHIWGQGSAF